MSDRSLKCPGLDKSDRALTHPGLHAAAVVLKTPRTGETPRTVLKYSAFCVNEKATRIWHTTNELLKEERKGNLSLLMKRSCGIRPVPKFQPCEDFVYNSDF